MKIENEITVMVTSQFDELHESLINNGFKVCDKYITNDIYMIDKNIDLNELSTLEILKKCIVVREIVGIKKVLLYKYKEYAANGDILVNGKVECPITDIIKAIEFMEAINYTKLIEINDLCTEYVNDELELIVQYVNNEYLFFEVEEEPRHINKRFSSIEEIKNTINKYNLPFARDNYFTKKAEIILNKKLKRN